LRLGIDLKQEYVTPHGMIEGRDEVGDRDFYRDPRIHGQAEQIGGFPIAVRNSAAAYCPSAVRTIAGAYSTLPYTYAPSGSYEGASGGYGSIFPSSGYAEPG
jgi:hypothetical protein